MSALLSDADFDSAVLSALPIFDWRSIARAERAARIEAEAALAEARRVLDAPTVLDAGGPVYFGLSHPDRGGWSVKIPGEMLPFFREWNERRIAALSRATEREAGPS